RQRIPRLVGEFAEGFLGVERLIAAAAEAGGPQDRDAASLGGEYFLLEAGHGVAIARERGHPFEKRAALGELLAESRLPGRVADPKADLSPADSLLDGVVEKLQRIVEAPADRKRMDDEAHLRLLSSRLRLRRQSRRRNRRHRPRQKITSIERHD